MQRSRLRKWVIEKLLNSHRSFILFSCSFKVLEKGIETRMQKILDDVSLFESVQFGLRRRKCTKEACLCLAGSFYRAYNSGL